MQEIPPFATKRRVGCVMWLAIIAIILSSISLLVDLVQEMAWDAKTQDMVALAATAVAPSHVNDAALPSIQTESVAESSTGLESAPQAATELPAAVSTPPPSPMPTSAPVQTNGPTYEQVCKADTNNMTDPQIEAFSQQYIGQNFTGWQGWVYDVASRTDGTYNLEVAMEERGLFWGRNIVIENIPQDLAFRLNVEQQVVMSGRIVRNETTFEVLCNPLVVDNYAVQE